VLGDLPSGFYFFHHQTKDTAMSDAVERSMRDKDPLDDLDITLRAFTLPQLKRLQDAFRHGLVITGKYRDADSKQGCPIYHGIGVTSRAELLAYDFGSDEALWAVRRVVRYVDAGTLSLSAIARAVDRAVADRQPQRQNARALVASCC
jgi:hypothetical protein